VAPPLELRGLYGAVWDGCLDTGLEAFGHTKDVELAKRSSWSWAPQNAG